MAEGVGGAGSTGSVEQYMQFQSEYSDVVNELKHMFPDQTELDIEQAITAFLAENPEKKWI
ncbi:MAG: hypothetical protein HUK40_14135 [Desulfobacter sp.]|nr:hypothetical protein [Desulfobacter sp.]